MITYQTVYGKLLVYVVLSFIAAAASVLFIANYRIEKVIDQNQTALYEERLNAITNVLAAQFSRLQATGWQEAYQEDFQAVAIENLRSTFYVSADSSSYPVIIDGTGAIVMHPGLAKGSKAINTLLDVTELLKKETGNFNIEGENGQKTWVLFHYFKDWDWVVAYTIPFATKYRDAYQLRNNLLLIMGLIVCILSLATALLLRKMIQPVTALTEAASAFTLGKEDYPLNVKGNDEFAVLAATFVRMRDTIREKIGELASRNEELSASEERFRLFIDQAADAVFVHDFQGNLLMVNRQACESTGYSREELLAMTVADVDVDEVHEGTFEELWGTLSKENKLTLEGAHRRKDGSIFPVEVRIGLLESNSKQLILALARDVTLRLETERKLKESEEKLRRVIEQSPVAMAVSTPDGEITTINAKFVELFGYTAADLHTLDDWFSKAHPESLARRDARKMWACAMKEYFSTHMFKTIFTPVHCNDGSIKDIEFGFEAVGEQYITVFVDVTERNRARHELLKEKEFSEHAINSMPGIFFLYQRVAEQFVLKKCNTNHAILLGYSKDEIQDTNIESFFSIEDMGRLKTMIAGLHEQQSIETEVNILKRDGNTLPLYIQAMIFTKDDDSFLVGTGLDVSELRQAEKERRRLQSQLIQAQKMEAIGTLAGGIAHDFNNILSAIIGYTELSLMLTDKKSKVSTYLNNLMNAGSRAKDLVQQILSYSRQTEHELKPVLVKTIAQEVIKLLSVSLPSSIDIQADIDSDSLVMGDPSQIHQILMNLCTNASHAMGETGGVLHLELKTVHIDIDTASQLANLQPGSHVNVNVSDTGHGMTAEVLERIFDPFFTTKEKGDGTGMGLAVVHGIVQSYGGMIYAYSEAGRGSSFKIFLPAIDNDELGVEQLSEPQDVFPRGNERILLIDDEPDIIIIGRQMLENLGYEVDTTTSSPEALSIFRRQKDLYDLVITDMTMPHIQGDKLAQEFVAIRPDIPIILCTGFNKGLTEGRFGGLPFKGLLMKPIIRSELAALVRKVIDESILT